jgi:flagellar M-ring protein FliF
VHGLRERLTAIWNSIKTAWGNLSRTAKIITIVSFAGVVALCVVLAVMLNQKHYVLLYNDLTTTQSTQALAILSERGITPHVEPNGAIMVEEREADIARMYLAEGGFPGEAYTYDTYAPSLTSTQSDKDRFYVFQLQDRLQANIEGYSEVEQAVVNINLPSTDLYATTTDAPQPSASVFVKLRPGAKLSTEQVQGIVNIVKNSIPNLTEDNISVTGEQGDLKIGLIDSDINNTKLRLTEEVNSAARQKVLAVVQPRYGTGNVEVQVNSTLNTQETATENITYHPFDPDNPTRNPLDYAENQTAKTDLAQGVAAGVVGANDNVETPEYGEEQE